MNMNEQLTATVAESLRGKKRRWPLDNGSLSYYWAIRRYSKTEAMRLIIDSTYGRDILSGDGISAWAVDSILNEIFGSYYFLRNESSTRRKDFFSGKKEYGKAEENMAISLINECGALYIAETLHKHDFGNARIHIEYSLNQIAGVFMEMQQSKTTNDSAIAFAKENAEGFQKFYQKLFDGTKDYSNPYEDAAIAEFIHTAEPSEFIDYGFCSMGRQEPLHDDGYGIMRAFEHNMTSGKAQS